jgi:hypothetical protein
MLKRLILSDGSEGIDVIVVNGGTDIFQISKGVNLV